jgi:DNA gyrase/topoisomerase IV subunit A
MKPEQVEEWIREVQERPSSAPLIIQFISRRLADLTGRYQELLAENIELRTERRVEEYESKIANLEYQLELLRRQMSGNEYIRSKQVEPEMMSVLLYDHAGRVMRLDVAANQMRSGQRIGRAEWGGEHQSIPPRLLLTRPQEELMFVFDSGRILTMPVMSLPAAEGDTLAWEHGYQVDIRSGEELAAVVCIGMMTVYDYCLQVSRRGCAKRMMLTSFENYVSNRFVGAGTKSKSDKTCCLVFSGKDDRLVLASKEGYLLTCDVSEMPYTTEEVIRLGTTDHIVESFVVRDGTSLLFMTQNRKVIHRDISWLDKAESFRSKGQAVISQSRREAGIRIIGAAAVDEKDWAVMLSQDGTIYSQPAAELMANGTTNFKDETEKDGGSDLVCFALFRPADRPEEA